MTVKVRRIRPELRRLPPPGGLIQGLLRHCRQQYKADWDAEQSSAGTPELFDNMRFSFFALAIIPILLGTCKAIPIPDFPPVHIGEGAQASCAYCNFALVSQQEQRTIVVQEASCAP